MGDLDVLRRRRHRFPPVRGWIKALAAPLQQRYWRRLVLEVVRDPELVRWVHRREWVEDYLLPRLSVDPEVCDDEF